MKKAAFVSLLVGIFSSVSLAKPNLEVSASIPDSKCAKNAVQLILDYTEIFDFGSDVKTIRFENFTAEPLAGDRQDYEANVTLLHQFEISLGVNTTRLLAKFSSPYACEDLKIQSIEDRGIDTSDPLYKCLNEDPRLLKLEAKRVEASQAYETAMEKACAPFPDGNEKRNCRSDWQQSKEGQNLLKHVKETMLPVALAWGDCYMRFPRD